MRVSLPAAAGSACRVSPVAKSKTPAQLGLRGNKVIWSRSGRTDQAWCGRRGLRPQKPSITRYSTVVSTRSIALSLGASVAATCAVEWPGLLVHPAPPR